MHKSIIISKQFIPSTLRFMVLLVVALGFPLGVVWGADVPTAIKPERDALVAAGDAYEAKVNTIIAVLTTERDDARAQVATLTNQLAAANAAKAAAETALAAEKAKIATLTTQLAAAIASTKAKAESAAVAAIRSVQ